MADSSLIDALAQELGVVITCGADLPERPQREGHVRNLLLRSDQRATGLFGDRARRLLHFLDDALEDAWVAETSTTKHDPVLTDEQYRACRVLLGLDPEYRFAGAMARRAAAADILGFGWASSPRTRPQKIADSFYHGPERKVRRLIAECLVAFAEPFAWDPDPEAGHVLLREVRSYEVDSKRNVVALRCERTIRARGNGLNHVDFAEDGRRLARVAQHSLDVESVSGGHRGIVTRRVDQKWSEATAYRISFSPPLTPGEEITYVWKEAMTYKPTDDLWASYFVSAYCTTDKADLELRVHFAGDTPGAIWSFAKLPQIDYTLTPREGHELEVDPESTVSFRVRSDPGRTFGIAWEW